MNTFKKLGNIIAITGTLNALWVATAYSQSHSLIYDNKSSLTKNTFISQGIDGEYGSLSKVEKASESENQVSSVWRGFGIRNSVGMEIMKFMQFSVSHSFLNLKSKGDTYETLGGSRFSGDLRFVFAAPIGNMELGGGAIGSRYEYRNHEISSEYMGNGYYYSLGINYFLSSRVSIFSYAKSYDEKLVRSGGNSLYENILLDTRGVSAGFNIWL